MRTRFILLAMSLLLMGSMINSQAAELAGVTLPDTMQVGNSHLVLNGLGLRKKFVVKVYVAGLYLAQKSSDSNAILKDESPKRIVMHFVRDVSKNQIGEAFDDSFESNAPDVLRTSRADIDRFFRALSDVKAGDEMIFTIVPGKGTTFAINGAEKVTIANPAFAQALLSVWLGPKPPNADLKRGMLGQ